jgi:hypothetical protein
LGFFCGDRVKKERWTPMSDKHMTPADGLALFLADVCPVGLPAERNARLSIVQPHEKFAAHRPRKGDKLSYKGQPKGIVTRVEGNLCYVDAYGEAPFIWCFRDGLNNLHDWPSRGNVGLVGQESP